MNWLLRCWKNHYAVRFGAAGLFAAIACSFLALAPIGCGKKPAVHKTPPATSPATHPAKRPATTQSTIDRYPIDLGSSAAADAPLRLPPQTLVDLVRLTQPAGQPKCPVTQPLDNALPLEEAGKFVIEAPVYLDERGDLWITRSDAPPLSQVIAQASQIPASRMTENDKPPPTVHFVRENVVFVHWMFPEGLSQPLVFCRAEDGSFYAADANRHYHILPAASPATQKAATKPATQPVKKPATLPAGDQAEKFDWPRAFSWSGNIIVPTPRGVALLTPAATGIRESDSPDLLVPGAGDSRSRTRVVVAADGFFAWAPPDGAKPGSRGIVRFIVDQQNQQTSGNSDDSGGAAPARGKWEALGPNQNWPADILYLAPLLDGSVIRIALDPRDPNHLAAGGRDEPPVQLSFALAESAQIDKQLQQKVEQLIDQLSDDAQAKRREAYRQLQQYGPPIWPILQKKLHNAGSAEAQARVEELLKNSTVPTLGTITLLDGKLRLLNYFADGGALFYAGGGVAIPQPPDDPIIVTPAWITVRPSRYVELLPDAMTNDLDPDHCHIFAYYNEYIVSDKVHGPRRFSGDSLDEMLPRSMREFGDFLGLDNSGRWLFRPLASAGSSAATSPSARGGNVPTLIIDPRLPDATPRLPIWNLQESAVGWDEHNWPCVQDAMLKTPAALEAAGWRRFDEKMDRMMTKPEQVPPIVAPPVTQPATHPVKAATQTTMPAATHSATQSTAATRASLLPASRPAGAPLLVDARGNCYYGGHDSLKVFCFDGTVIDWPLPDNAIGRGKVHLIRAPDGRLFLFNTPGRVIRIRPRRPTPTDPAPFVVEAAFTHDLPNIDDPARIWLDPAGRIDIAYGNNLAILFPSGQVPQPIANLMPEDPLEQK